MCPEMDEYGAIPQCEFNWRKTRCEPTYACHQTRTLPMPKCELNHGYKRWRQYSTMMTNNVQAIAAAIDRCVCVYVF